MANWGFFDRPQSSWGSGVVLGSYSPPSYTPPAPPTPPIVTGIEPAAYEAILYGKTKPLFVGGKALMGGRPCEGVYWGGTQAAPLVTFIAYHAEAANPSGTRTITDARLRGKSVSYDGSGNLLDADLAGGRVQFRTGTRTQLPFDESILRNGSGAIAYRSGILSCWSNIPVAAFGGIVPMPSIEISDSSFGVPEDGIDRQDAIEVLLRYSRLEDSEFEVSLPGNDLAWIVGSKSSLLEFLQQLQAVFVHWNITYTDKMRIIDPTSFSVDVDITRANHLRDSMRFSKTDPLLIPRKKNYTYIDKDRDFEPNVVSAQEDIYPQPATSSVNETSIELPIVTTAAQATADIHVSMFEELAARSQMEATLGPSLFETEAGDSVRFADHDAINYIGRTMETQHDFNSYQVDIKTVEVLNCGAQVDDEYAAEGVEFAGGASGSLTQLSTAEANTSKFTFSGWFLAANLATAAFVFRIEQGAGGVDAIALTVGGLGDGYGVSAFFVKGSFTNQFHFDSLDELSDDQWYHIFVSADLDFAAGLKISHLYLNGVNVTRGGHTDSDPAFEADVNLGHVSIPVAGQDRTYSDVMVWLDQCIDPAVHIDKFIDGGDPVDPAVAVAEFGTPAFLFTGNAAEFVVNAGTGGSLTPAGTIQDSDGPP